MAPISMLQRLRSWTTRHPWMSMFAWFTVLTIVFWLLPPNNNLAAAALDVAVAIAITLGINFLRFRSFFPTKQEIDNAETRADEIATAVRQMRDRDSRR